MSYLIVNRIMTRLKRASFWHEEEDLQSRRMSYTINEVVIERIESLEDVEKTLKVFSNCLIVKRDYISQISVFSNVF